MMKRLFGTFCGLVLAGCGGVSDALPESQVSAQAVGAVRISTTGLSSTTLRESADAIAGYMAKSKIPQIVQGSGLLTLNAASIDPATNPKLKAFDEAMAQFREGGATALWFVVDEVGGVEDFSKMTGGPDDGVVALVQTDGRMGSDQIAQIASTLTSTQLSAQSVGGGWFRVTDPSHGEPAAIADPSAENAKALESAARACGATTIGFGTIVRESMRTAWQDGMAEGNPMFAGMVSDMEESIASLQVISAGAVFGTAPELHLKLAFSNQEAAAGFADSWAETCDGMAAMAGMFLAAPKKKGQPPAVDPKVFQTMAEALRLKQDGTSLNWTIAGPVWTQLIP